MKRAVLFGVLCGMAGCSTLQPTHDPESCDHIGEMAKRAGSDLVVDGDLYCATSSGDCELTPSKVVSSRTFANAAMGKIHIHILRQEAATYSDELAKRGEISLCYPAQLWFPSEGHHHGRYYLTAQADGNFRMAFYPRTKD